MSQDLPGNTETGGAPTVGECHHFANELVYGNYILDADLEDKLYDVLHARRFRTYHEAH